MNRRFLSLIVCLISFLLFFSFPSICFSELKTVEGYDCDDYLGNMKDKKELEQFRKTLRKSSIDNGVLQFLNRVDFTRECFNDVISKYVERVVVVSHTEKGRNICDKVKITLDPDVINKYLYQDFCRVPRVWEEDVVNILKEKDNVFKRKNESINLGLIIETKIPDLDVSKKEQLENEEEQQFFFLIRWGTMKDKYKVIDRRHLTKILEEQKLSSSGIADSETVKLGKLLNLDIIVLRLIYENSRVTKVLKVETGEVLLFKTYKPEKEEWIFYETTEFGNGLYGEDYYDKQSIELVSAQVVKVKTKHLTYRRDKSIQLNKSNRTEPPPPLPRGIFKNSLVSWELINCMNRTIQITMIEEYDDKGEFVSRHDYNDILPIIPDSTPDMLRRKICQK